MTYKDFNYLKNGGVREEDAKKEFDEVLKTMNDMSFTEDEILSIWKCVAAILHLGQLEFDKMSFDDEKSPSKPGKLKNEPVARQIAQLLGYDEPEAFVKILLQKVNVIRNQEMWAPQGL